MRHEIYAADGKRLIGYAVETTGTFGGRVFRAYWLGESTPVKEKRWNRDFSSVAEVERYLRAWLADHDRIEVAAVIADSPVLCVAVQCALRSAAARMEAQRRPWRREGNLDRLAAEVGR